MRLFHDIFKPFISITVSISLVISSPGVAGLIDDVAVSLGIREFPEDFPELQRLNLARVITREGQYFMENTHSLLNGDPVTVKDLHDRRIEVRSFNLYGEPNFLSGYIATQELEKQLWGDVQGASDIWFLISADDTVHGLEVRSFPRETVPLKWEFSPARV